VLYSFYFYPARLWTVRRAGSGASSGAGRWWVMRRVVASDAKTDWMIVVQAIAVLLEEADCGVHRGFSGGAGRSTPLRSERVRRGAKHPGCPSGYRLKTEYGSDYSGRCELARSRASHWFDASGERHRSRAVCCAVMTGLRPSHSPHQSSALRISSGEALPVSGQVHPAFMSATGYMCRQLL
jgi:hypothetical protein